MAEKRYRASELLQDINGERLSIVAPEDDAVLRLCERVGFGAVMDSAYRQWRRLDPMGAFLVGTCVGIARPDAASTPAAESEDA